MISLVPVSYKIEPERKLIRTVCTGDANPEEVNNHFRDLACDPERPDQLNVLLDLTEVTSIPESGQIRGVGITLRKYGSILKFNACAIVAGSDVLFGMMRMFEVFARDSFVVTQVFRSTADAEVWLATQERKTDSAA
jgi:hypothetical protein